jgi:hypothetical protein
MVSYRECIDKLASWANAGSKGSVFVKNNIVFSVHTATFTCWLDSISRLGNRINFVNSLSAISFPFNACIYSYILVFVLLPPIPVSSCIIFRDSPIYSLYKMVHLQLIRETLLVVWLALLILYALFFLWRTSHLVSLGHLVQYITV